MQTHSSLIPVIALQASLINAHAIGINALEIFRQFQKIAKVWPPPKTHITRFVANLTISSYKYSTA